MNYRDLIKEAFWITLRNRFLWFFGFFISGGIGSSNFNLLQEAPGTSTTDRETHLPPGSRCPPGG
jgi:hypothetical protein